MNTVKIFLGSTPEEVEEAYKTWLAQHQEIEIVGGPIIRPGGGGWKLEILYRPAPQSN